MSAESRDEIIQILEGQEKLDENRRNGYESIDDLKSTSGSHTDSDNNNSESAEYHYIEDTNPPSDHQVLEEGQLEASDYEDITGTNPAYDYIQVINEPLTLTSKCKKAVRFLGPIFASVTLNIIAGFYTSLTFHTLVLPRNIKNITFGDGEIAAEGGITFNVFSALAAAYCAPLMIRFDFRKVALAGSVLIICFSLSLLFGATADVLSFIVGGLAIGHLWTLAIVAIVDNLYTRRTLALTVSHAGFTLGNIGSIFLLETTGWYIGKRPLAIPAVMGLITGCFLQRPSQAQENLSMLFKHPPFYFLISIRFVTSLGLSILQAEIIILDDTHFQFVSRPLLRTVLVIIWIFQKEKLKEPFLFSMGVSVVVLGLVAMVHEDVLESREGEVASSLMLGAVIAFSQVILPLAMVNTSGRRNLKLSLPLLVCFDEMGRLIGGSIWANISPSPVNAALYCAGVSLIIAGVGAITAAVVIKRSPRLSNETEAEDHVQEIEDRVENYAHGAEDQAQKIEDRYREACTGGRGPCAGSRGPCAGGRGPCAGGRGQCRGPCGQGDTLMEVEDHVQESENNVEDHIQEPEDNVEDHVQEIEYHVEDRVQEAEYHVEDHVQEAEDYVEDHVEAAEDQVQEPGDNVKDYVQEAEDCVQDHVQEAEDNVEDQVQEANDRVEDRV